MNCLVFTITITKKPVTFNTKTLGLIKPRAVNCTQSAGEPYNGEEKGVAL